MKIPILSGLLKPRASPKNSLYGGTYSFLFGGTASGKTVNERTAMQTTAVYACEAYDHLGVVSTIESGSGLVIIRGTEDTIPEIREILDNLPFPVEVLDFNETEFPALVKARE